MRSAPIHPQEDRRLTALSRLELLDTLEEEAYDDIVALAAGITGRPIALVSLVDRDRQWFKAHYGLAARETPRELAFCAHAILDPDQPFVVEDATRDERFRDNPLVTGEPRVIFYAGVPLRDPEAGLPLGTLCVIDHRAGSLDADQLTLLRALARQVERLLEGRLREQALAGALDRAEAATRAKSRFLSVMSHEIRTPLNGIIGSAQLLAEEELGGSSQQLLETIRSCGEGLLTLIGDILDLSRLEARHLELDARSQPLAPLLASVCDALAGSAHAKGLILTWSIANTVPDQLTCDGPRLRQVLLNLVGNAVKFTASGFVDLHASSDDGGLRFAVSDTGIGIEPAHSHSLFEPFEQGDPRIHESYGGSGLGLSICRQLVDLMGGSIHAERNAEGGATFVVELPVREAAEPAGSRLRPPAVMVEPDHDPRVAAHLQTLARLADVSDDLARVEVHREGHELVIAGHSRCFLPLTPATLARALGHDAQQAAQRAPKAPATSTPLRVLVAEDDPVSQSVVRSMLGKLGATVTVVDDGLAAIAAIEAEPFDLALLDWQMPRLDGLETARRLRAAGHQLCIAALTARAASADREACYQAGMDVYLTKPLRREQLQRLCTQLRQERRAAAGA